MLKYVSIKVKKSTMRMEKVLQGTFFFYLMDTNQNTPSNFDLVKMLCILPGQQSRCAYIQLKIKAYKEFVQEGTFRYFWVNLAYKNQKFLHTEWKSCFPFKTHYQKRCLPQPSLKNFQQGPINSLSEQ